MRPRVRLVRPMGQGPLGLGERRAIMG